MLGAGGKKIMKNKKQKTIIITLFVILFLLILPLQNIATTQQGENPSKQIQLKIYNIAEQKVRTQTVDFKDFISLFDPINNFDKYSAKEDMQSKIHQLLQSDFINENEKNIIRQQFQQISNENGNKYSKGLFFDLFNIFNGFGFAIKGEKTQSFLDLPVAKFPFLNSNFTALFSGFNSFEGNGFIFTLGTNGFRYIYDYDRDEYAFPYFSSVNGWFIGYTGIILEVTVSDVIGETYEGTYIIGVGMNVATLWNT